MNGYTHRSSVLCLLVAATALASCTPEASQVSLAEVEATVLELENEMNLAVDGLQCDLTANGDREPIFVGGGNVVRTSAELQGMCEQMVSARTGAVFVPDAITANGLSADVAYVVREGNYTINFKDGAQETVYLVMTTIWHRQDDGWKMVHLHESFRDL